MSNTTTAYQFDSNGYLIGETMVMSDPLAGGWLVPADCTLTKPTAKKGYWISGFVSMEVTFFALWANSHVIPPVPQPTSTTSSLGVTADLYNMIALMASLVGPGTSQVLIKSISFNIYSHLLYMLFSIFSESNILPTIKLIWSSTVSLSE